MLFFSWLVYAVATLDELMEILFVQWMFTDIKDQDTDLINKMVLKFQTFAKYFSTVHAQPGIYMWKQVSIIVLY